MPGRRAAALCLVVLAGCGGDAAGPEEPRIAPAKSFELVGLQPDEPLRAGRTGTLDFHVEQPEGGPLTRYKTGDGPHTGVHLIFVSEDLSRLLHRHPPVARDGGIRQDIALPSGGRWRVVADVYPDLGANTIQNFQLTADVEVRGAAPRRPLGAFRAEQTVSGVRFTMRRPRRLKALEPQFLDVEVRAPGGAPARFDPYYGALAHAIFFRADDLAYFHTHVCGAGVRGCAASVVGAGVAGRSTSPGKLRLGVLLPGEGRWRLFLQARVEGRVVTVPYTLEVT